MTTSSRWFRLYAETYRDPKIWRLSDRLFRFWVNCLCLASENEGFLPAHTDVAFHLRMTPTKVLESMIKLKHSGLLDETAEKRFMPHNWHGRQYESDSSTERVRRFRERSRGNDMKRFSNGTEQRQIQKQNRTETEQSVPLRAAEFAAAFPDQSDQASTVREYISLVTPQEEDLVFACLERYKSSAQVADGVIQAGWAWLKKQKDNSWCGDWSPPKRKLSRHETMIQEALAIGREEERAKQIG